MGVWDQTSDALRNPAAPLHSISARAFTAAVAIARAETVAELDERAREGAAPLGFTSVLLAELKKRISVLDREIARRAKGHTDCCAMRK